MAACLCVCCCVFSTTLLRMIIYGRSKVRYHSSSNARRSVSSPYQNFEIPSIMKIHSRLCFEVLYRGSINGQRIDILLRGLDAIDVGSNE